MKKKSIQEEITTDQNDKLMNRQIKILSDSATDYIENFQINVHTLN